VSDLVTLITGTRTGIGKHLAQHYAALGHTVVGCSRTPPDWSCPGFQHLEADVADEQQVRRVMTEINGRFKRLDHLVNNAGVASLNHSLLTPGATVQKVLATNALGTFLVSREAAKLMQRRRYGRIVNFTTVAVPLKLEGEAAYVASKAAVQGLTEVMARELASFGITVNAVGPGPIDTDLTRGVPNDKIESLLRRQAIPRRGTFADVCNVVDFFLRPESGFVTGQVLFLGGV
jgi:3-oxoacyl-[acyl-carrier protein] reductase